MCLANSRNSKKGCLEESEWKSMVDCKVREDSCTGQEGLCVRNQVGLSGECDLASFKK